MDKETAAYMKKRVDMYNNLQEYILNNEKTIECLEKIKNNKPLIKMDDGYVYFYASVKCIEAIIQELKNEIIDSKQKQAAI